MQPNQNIAQKSESLTARKEKIVDDNKEKFDCRMMSFIPLSIYMDTKRHHYRIMIMDIHHTCSKYKVSSRRGSLFEIAYYGDGFIWIDIIWLKFFFKSLTNRMAFKFRFKKRKPFTGAWY